MYSFNDTLNNHPQASVTNCRGISNGTCCHSCDPILCRTCCISYLIEDHTYCVLKNLCRKIIKDLCREQCRERYTVFDGGNSMNSRLYRFSTSCRPTPGPCPTISDDSICGKFGMTKGGKIVQRGNLKGAVDYDSDSDTAGVSGSRWSKKIKRKKADDAETGRGERDKSKGRKRGNDFDVDDGYERRNGKSKKGKRKGGDEEDDEDDYRFERKRKGKSEKKKGSGLADEDGDDVPGRRRKGKSKKKKGAVSDDEDDDDEPGKKGKGKSKTKKGSGLADDNDDDVTGRKDKGKSKKKKGAGSDDEDDDEFRKKGKGKSKKKNRAESDDEDSNAVFGKKGKEKSKNKKGTGLDNGGDEYGAGEKAIGKAKSKIKGVTGREGSDAEDADGKKEKRKPKSKKGEIDSGDEDWNRKEGKRKSKDKKGDAEDGYNDGVGKKRKPKGGENHDDNGYDDKAAKKGKRKSKLIGRDAGEEGVELFNKEKNTGYHLTVAKKSLKNVNLMKSLKREIPLIADLRMKIRKGESLNFDKQKFSKALSEGDVYSKRICVDKKRQKKSRLSKRCLSYRDFQLMKSRLDEIKFCDFLRADLEQRELIGETRNCCCNPRPNYCGSRCLC